MSHEIILFPEANNALVNEIQRKLRLRMNGETAAKIRKDSPGKNKTLGASIIHLRELAGQYTPDQTVANALWRKNWRETKILATILAEPAKMSKVQLGIWLDECDTVELAEQLAYNLLVNWPLTDIIEITDHRIIWQTITLTNVIARKAVLNKLQDVEANLFINFTRTQSQAFNNHNAATALGRAFALIYRKMPDYRITIDEILQQKFLTSNFCSNITEPVEIEKQCL